MTPLTFSASHSPHTSGMNDFIEYFRLACGMRGTVSAITNNLRNSLGRLVAAEVRGTNNQKLHQSVCP
jgi:hypothetical protein